MPVLVWDQTGERRYETGIDRGVLYTPDGGAYPWNGLTSLVESRSVDVKSFYQDGVKYLDYKAPSAYSAKVQAFTYPDALDQVLGNVEIAPGLIAYDQRARLFHLSYRTLIANDVEGVDYAYRIHVVYNITASQSDLNFDTVGESVSGKAFEWNLSGTPNQMFGLRPTSHIAIDSRTINPGTLETINARLYGSDIDNPILPSAVEFMSLVAP